MDSLPACVGGFAMANIKHLAAFNSSFNLLPPSAIFRASCNPQTHEHQAEISTIANYAAACRTISSET
jgi:hypothetical protein